MPLPNPQAKAAKRHSQPVVLLVSGGRDRGAESPGIAGVMVTSRNRLQTVLSEFAHPAVIVSPLSSKGFDAVEIARILADCAYRGVYYAITEPLPAPHIILDEVRRTAPELVFDLLTEDDLDLLKQTGLPG